MKSYTHLLSYESGAMPQEQVLPWFRTLIDSGDIWKLPTDYLTAAAYIIDTGNYAHTEMAKRGLN